MNYSSFLKEKEAEEFIKEHNVRRVECCHSCKYSVARYGGGCYCELNKDVQIDWGYLCDKFEGY